MTFSNESFRPLHLRKMIKSTVLELHHQSILLRVGRLTLKHHRRKACGQVTCTRVTWSFTCKALVTSLPLPVERLDHHLHGILHVSRDRLHQTLHRPLFLPMQRGTHSHPPTFHPYRSLYTQILHYLWGFFLTVRRIHCDCKRLTLRQCVFVVPKLGLIAECRGPYSETMYR